VNAAAFAGAPRPRSEAFVVLGVALGGHDPRTCAGVDEVGRGCLFGPVFAGAVVLPASALEPLARGRSHDSKALSARTRTPGFR